MTEYFLTSDRTWYETTQDLKRTMRLWGVSAYTVEPPREPLKRNESQAVAINFVHPKRGQVRVELDRWGWPARLNLRALYLSLEDLRMVEKRGMLEVMGEVLAQLAPPRSSAHEVLQVRVGASPDEITAAYRRLALQHHPDRGGDTRKMAAINAAYEALMGEAAVAS